MKTSENNYPLPGKTILFCFVLFLGLAGCFSNSATPFNGDYSETIEDRAIFEKLKGEALSDKYSNIEAVKILLDVKTDKLYFIASSKYYFHYDFALNVLNVPYSLGEFNYSSYSSDETRKYILATINYFPLADIYTLEFAGSDLSNPTDISYVFNKIKTNTYFGDSLTILANTLHIQQLINKGDLTVPFITPDVIFKDQQFQVVNEGIAYGYLKKIYDVKNIMDSVKPKDILLINQNPLDLPLCAAIVTTQFQTPLSHINVLSHNRKMVCMMYTESWFDATFKKLENKLVKLTVNKDTFFLEEAKYEDAVKFWKNQPEYKLNKLKSDLSVQSIIDIKNINYTSKDIVGSKAVNFGELNKMKIEGLFNVPEGAFGIPFYFYKEHILQTKIDSLLQILATDTSIQNNSILLEKHLKTIRKAIKNAPLDQNLLQSVENKIRANNFGKTYRFRSSTNAEDISGFNGAGLYDSKTGILNDSSKSIENAIKEVWASTFTYRAYNERSIFNIEESSVCMGILVHRSFPEETANGVAITKNLYRTEFPGFVVNVQIGEISVVEPGDSIICDQFVVYNTIELGDRSDHIAADYITFSNQNNGIPVLSEEQINILYLALGEIKSYYYTRHSTNSGYRDYSLDIEFKFDGLKGLYIKQVRPY